MDKYKNFGIGTIVWAYYLLDADEERMQKDIDYFKSVMPLNKAYLENHRGLIDVPREKMILAKKIFERNGIKTSGCITSTGLVGKRKPAVFDTYCYTDETHREAYLKIVEDLSSVFDEIILDDYFFCACRCEKCIEAKKDRSWSEYRLDLMEDFSRVITKRAKEINPNMNFIIKYPNWYESWQETGYNPEKQKDIFDMVYTGTETRNTRYSLQHLQRYHSYSMVRYMENIAPGQNGGGWIDPYGCENNLSRFLEQADFTLLSKAKELMLFNFEEMTRNRVFPPLAAELLKIDALLSKLGTPTGVCTYEPHNGDGEDLLYTYLGMVGVAIEPTPVFKEDAPALFLSRNSCVDPDVMSKLERYVRKGGIAIITTGFLKEELECGIKDMTSLRPTGRHVAGDEFLTNFRNHLETTTSSSKESISFEVFSIKNNASWADVSVIADDFNFPLISEDNYGEGRLFILNVPDNFSDFAKLPLEVLGNISKVLTEGREVYLCSDEKISMFSYDNGVFGFYSFTDRPATAKIVIREKCIGIRDIETGKIIDSVVPLPKPSKWFDCCSVMPEHDEYSIEIPVSQGALRFFEILR